jgi:hypothetical protein
MPLSVSDAICSVEFTVTRRWFMRLLPLGAFAKSFRPASATAAAVISVADYGAVPGADDVTAEVRAAICHLPKRGGATLLFAPGVYNLAADAADDAAMRFVGIENLTVDGNGAALNFRGKTYPFVFSHCDGLSVRGLTVDWPRPPFSQGEVLSVGSGGLAVDVQVDKEFPVDGSEKVEAITTHDRGTLRMTIGGLDEYHVVAAVKLIGPQQIRLILNRPLAPHVGDVVVLRHQVYGLDAFRLSGCKDIFFDGVTVYATPGMAFWAAGCTNIAINHFLIEPRPGTTRLMSTCADGLHIASSHGKIDIRNCYLAGLGDDCINVHGRVLVVVERVDAHTLLVDAQGRGPFRDIDVTPAGDRVEFLSGRLVASLGEREVTEAEGGAHERLRFANELPPDLLAGDLLCDLDEPADVVISDCRFPGNRARAILAHRNTAIERCFFSDQRDEAILILFNNTAEGGPTIGNVTVAQNEFRDTGRSQLRHGAISKWTAKRHRLSRGSGPTIAVALPISPR